MSSIDERIVQMRFNNRDFEKNVQQSKKSLEDLKKGLNLDASKKSLQGLQAAGNKFNIAGIGQGIQSIAGRFSALSVIGVTALATIANQAVNTGLQMARSLTVEPILAGFREYELKMGSIQTILANTSRYGTSLETVTGALDELNTYADKTIYNFGEMTKNAGLFTNAGMRVEEATSIIKGFSNEAAASGTSASGAASAAYQLSQAFSAGKITLIDWRSLTNQGMGNKNMQNGILEIAQAMGTLEGAELTISDVQNDFNGSLEKGWLKADVMSNYLKIMAGDMSEAEQRALGLSDATIDMFTKQQATAEDAATKVRTFTQLYSTLQEGVGSSWAQTFDILIGDFDQATDMWTSVNDTLGAMISASGEARNKLIQGWADLGGREVAIDAISQAWNNLLAVIKPIRQAFQEIFPPTTSLQLFTITTAIRDFFKSIKPGVKDTENLKRTFKGLFAVLDILWMVVKGVFGVLGRLFGVVGEGSSGFLEVTGTIGDFLVKVRDSIKAGTGLADVFRVIGDVLMWPIEALKTIGGYLGNFFAVQTFGEAWRNVADALQAVWTFLKPVADWFVGVFGEIRDAVKGAFTDMDPTVLMGALNAGLLGGALLLAKKFLDIIKGGINTGSGGFIDSIKGIFGEVTNTFKTMQDTLRAKALMNIAIAIGILTAAVIALSFVDTGKMFIALGAIGTMMGLLITLMGIVEKFGSIGGAVKLAIIGAALVPLATGMLIAAGAVVVLASAMKIFATMSWDDIGRSLVVLGASLAILAVGMTLMVGTLPGSAALLIASVALIALGGALKLISTLSWDDIGRGMTVIGASLAILAVGLTLMVAALPGAAALVVASGGLLLLGSALLIMSNLSWDDIGRGMVVLGGSLLILAVGLTLMIAALPGAVALTVAGAALIIFGGALQILAKLSWDEIGRAMTVLGASLAILAVGLTLMIVALPGAAALVVAAGALTVLAAVLKVLGGMTWDEIGAGLGAVASILGILAVAGILILPAIPGLLLLGVAINLLGIGALAAGAGMFLFAAGMTAMAAGGVAGALALKGALLILIGLIPTLAVQAALGVIAFAAQIAKGGAEFVAAFSVLLTSILEAVKQNGPMIIDVITVLIVALVDKIVTMAPYFAEAGMLLMTNVLNGIANRIEALITAGTNVILKFLQGIKDNWPKIVAGAGDTVLAFVNGIGDYVRNNSWRFVNAGSSLFRAVIDGIAMAIERGGSDIRYAGGRIGEALLEGAKNALGINSPSKKFRDEVMPSVFEGVEDGNKRNLSRADTAGKKIGDTMVAATKKSISQIRDAVATDIDAKPRIRPVLDLTEFRRSASTMQGYLPKSTLAVEASADRASTILATRRAQESARVEVPRQNLETRTNRDISFTQVINSPKAVSQAETYRSTKSLLSIAKTKLEEED